jgi:CubicO group peptidase (beta-lactamase class C family)
VDGDLRTLFDGAVAARVIPGAALAAGVGARAVVRVTAGGTGSGLPIGGETVFDLASLTKVMATTPAVLALADLGEVELTDPVGRWVPGFRDGARAVITLRQLLTHTGGLLDSRRYYRFCASADEVLAAVAAEPLVTTPGERVGYSDLGFLLLGRVVERVTGRPLDQACAELVHRPLGLARTGYRPLRHPLLAAGPFAVTTEPGAEPAVGRPHDRNAQACGDVAGHAGLFAVLDDVAAYAAWWAGPAGGPVSPAARAAAMRCATEGLGGCRGLGWLVHGDGDERHDFLGPGWSPAAVLHTGFTGTSIAVDPARGWWAVLLTAAVHLGRDRPEVGRLRARVHQQVAAVLG